MMEQTFHRDLQRGIDIELDVLNIIKKKYISATLVNKYKGYDIWIPELSKSIEVKSDLKSNYTNNIVIEIEMYGKPSGLMVTEADYWVFYDGNQYVSIKPMEIIRCIFLNKLTHAEFIGKGDTVPKKAFLVKKDILFQYGKVLGND